MELVNTSADKFLQYRVSTGADVTQMKDCVGKILEIKNIIQHNTVNQTGEDAICTSIETVDGQVYQSLSPTVSECCQQMYRIFGEEWETINLKVEVQEKRANSGNRFLSLALVQ